MQGQGRRELFLPTMRLLANIPHPVLRISIHLYNEKYIIEMEAGQYRQAYKISTESVGGLEEVKAMIDQDFIDASLKRFSSMHEDFKKAFDKHITK